MRAKAKRILGWLLLIPPLSVFIGFLWWIGWENIRVALMVCGAGVIGAIVLLLPHVALELIYPDDDD